MPAKFGPDEYVCQWLDNLEDTLRSEPTERSAPCRQEESDDRAKTRTKPSQDTKAGKRKRHSPLVQCTAEAELDDHQEAVCKTPETLRCRNLIGSQADNLDASETREEPRYNKMVEGKKYERRARRKTKADKYDLKLEKKARRTDNNGETTRERRQKKRKKSGKAINDEFQAPNVEQSRLTLKPNSNLGLFGKGKASSPQQRKGLPDLTFAEMTFLSRRSEINEEKLAKQKEIQNAKRRNNIQANKEVSEYFSKPIESNPRADALSQYEPLHKPQHMRSSPAKLERIVSSSRSRTTPKQWRRSFSGREANNNIAANPALDRTADASLSAHQVISGNGDVNGTPRQDKSTSYVSWSTSPPRQGRASARRRAWTGSNNVFNLTENFNPQDIPRKATHHNHDTNVSKSRQDSSMSNSSLAALAADSLRMNTLETARRTKADNLEAHNYSLEDLRDLIRLPSLRVSSQRPQMQASDDPHVKRAPWIHSPEIPKQRTSTDKPVLTQRHHSKSYSPPLVYSKEFARPIEAGTFHSRPSLLSERPRFLGEFRISPSKADTLLGRPTVARLPTQKSNHPSHGSRPSSHEMSQVERTSLDQMHTRPGLHLPTQEPNKHETFSHDPAEDYLDPQSLPPYSYATIAHDIPDDNFLQEALAHDLFPLDEADLLDHDVDPRYDFNGYRNDITCEPGNMYGDLDVPAPHTCATPDHDVPMQYLPQNAYNQGSSCATPTFHHTDYRPAHTTLDPAITLPSLTTASTRSSWTRSQIPPKEGRDVQSSRPTLLRAENLHDGRAGQDALEGFWCRPRMLY